jgi:hypothetical protein
MRWIVGANFLSDQDMTTPAHVRAAGEQPPALNDERRRGVSMIDMLLFLAAVWLVVSAVPVAYMSAGRLDAFWSDLVVGLALCAVTMVRLMRPDSSFVVLNVALGGWLLAVPFLFQYGLSAELWNNVLVGVVVLGLTGIGAAPASAQASDR